MSDDEYNFDDAQEQDEEAKKEDQLKGIMARQSYRPPAAAK